MVWAGVIGDKMIGPYFFNENVNADSYLNMLGDFVLPELMLANINPQEIWLQQDGAAAHFALRVRHFCDENFAGWIGRGGPINWPARSPDHNPLDFFVWPYTKSLVYKHPRPTNMDEMKDKITRVMRGIPSLMWRNVQNNTIKRIFKCVDVNGNHITNQGI